MQKPKEFSSSRTMLAKKKKKKKTEKSNTCPLAEEWYQIEMCTYEQTEEH